MITIQLYYTYSDWRRPVMNANQINIVLFISKIHKVFMYNTVSTISKVNVENSRSQIPLAQTVSLRSKYYREWNLAQICPLLGMS